MSNRKKSTKAFVGDSYQNFAAKLGQGTGNQNDASTYGFNPVTRVRLKLEWAYRGSWIVGRAVDTVAEDMTREGVTVISDDDPDKLKQLDREIQRLQIWKQVCATIKWSRLYGGAVAFLMIDGQNPSTPLRLDTLGPGQFKGLLPFDRWMLTPTYNDLVEDYGPDFGKPKFYQTTPDSAMGIKPMKLHYTRVIRIEGLDLPYWQKTTENMWGLSILERLWDRLIAFDSTTTGIAQLVYKAHLRTFKVEGLRNMIAAGAPAMKALVANLEMIRSTQNSEGLTLMDATDEFEVHQYAFGGLDAVLSKFEDQVAGALAMPKMHLFGQSAGGLGGTGEGEMRTYYDGIKQQQVNQLLAGLETVYRITYISKFGTEPSEDFAIDFNPLWQMTDPENAKVVVDLTGAITEALEAQAIDRATAMKELKAISAKTGVFTNIDDTAITEAESDPAPTPEALGLVPPPVAPVGAGPKGAAKPNKNGKG